MPEPDATSVASSATTPIDAQAAMASASPEALSRWRETGDVSVLLPKEEPTTPKADPSPAAPADAVAKPADAVPVPSTEPKDKTPRPDPRAEENRVPVLLSERAAAREEARLAKLEADTLKRELAALRAPAPDVKPAASSTATASDPNDPEPDPTDATKYPDGHYDRQFIRDQAAWVTRDTFRQRDAAEATRRQTAAQEADAERVNEAWSEKVNQAREKFPDFDAKALGPTEIRAGSPIDLWILESSLGAEVLYALQTTPGEVRRLNALPPMLQLRELAKLELTLGQPPVVKTETGAPAPPRTLGDRVTTVTDPVERALASKDVGAYMAAANAREIAAKKRS